MTGPFESPKFLVQQTRESLDEFRALCSGLFSGECYTHVIDVDPKTANKTFKIKFNRPLPGRARHIASTAISDLRHALDQAMCSAVTMLTGEDIIDVYFPFATNPHDLKGRLRTAKYQKLPQEILALLESFEPYPSGTGYPGGNALLANLSKTAGPNKHQVSCKISGQVSRFGVDLF